MNTAANGRLLLISSRPALCRPGEAPQSDWALPHDLRTALNVEEWRFPAFHLRVNAQSARQIGDWVVQSESGRSLMVCVSPGSLELLAPLFPQPLPQHVFLGLMGDGSAAKATGLGFPAARLVYPSMEHGQSQDSAGLLACIRQAPAFERVLLMKGNGGNLNLAPALTQVCSSFSQIEAYRRDAASPEAVNELRQRLTDWRVMRTHGVPSVADGMAGLPSQARASASSPVSPVVFYLTSSEAVDVLAPVVDSIVADTALGASCLRIVVTHPRIQERARQRGWSQVACIAPGVDALAQCLRQLLGFDTNKG